MNKQNKQWKVAADMVSYLSQAHLSYLGVIVVIFIIMYFSFAQLSSEAVSDFLSFSHGSSKIYMIVMGVIFGSYILQSYVQMGVTRKQTVIGNMIGAIGGALSLVVLLLVISLVQQYVFQKLNLHVIEEQQLFYEFLRFSEDSNNHFLLGQSFLSQISRLSITIISFWVSVLLDYMVGWMAAIGFKRGGFFEGIGFTVIGIIVSMISGILWTNNSIPYIPEIPLEGDPIYLWLMSVGVTILFIGLTYLIIRQRTKRMTV